MTKSDMFFDELNRRIESGNSPHDDASRARLREARVQLAIFAANDPEQFEKTIEKIAKSLGIEHLADES